MKTQSYIENQRFTQLWLWLILAGVLMGVMMTGEVVAVGITLIVFVVFYLLELRTKIDNEGIHYRFFPLHRKTRTIKWTDVDKAYVRQYKPLLEYGGWGFRYGLKGTAMNVRGNMGMQLVLKNGRKILIGTQRAKDLDNFLRYTINHDPNLV